MGINIEYKEGDKIGSCYYISEEPLRWFNGKYKSRFAKFKCYCGNIFIANIQNVRSGRSMCGCRRNKPRTHGCSYGTNKQNGYSTWTNMKTRCRNPTHKAYKHYGGRGIKVCDRWINSFENFLSDMGARPSLKHSIERINNDGNYEPENCKWATWAEQGKNKRENNTYISYVEFNGKQIKIKELAKIMGMSTGKLRHRLFKRNMTVEEAISTPNYKRIK